MTSVDPAAARLLQQGADIAGAAAGFALEYLTTTLPTSYGGPTATLIASTLKEIGGRTLSRREQARIGAASAQAIDRISARLIAGHHLRDDFSFGIGGERVPSEEIFEAVALKARDAYEEKKVRHLGGCK